MHYTTSCNTQSSAPEDGRDHRPKNVELIGIINRPLLLHLVGVIIIYVNDARSNKYQREFSVVFSVWVFEGCSTKRHLRYLLFWCCILVTFIRLGFEKLRSIVVLLPLLHLYVYIIYSHLTQDRYKWRAVVNTVMNV